jgi:hypothetical protein
MAEFEHKGVKITLQSSGQFTATIDSKYIAKPSLAAMKKFIDNKAMSTFKPFEAYYKDRWGSDLKLVKVIGIKKPRANAASWNIKPEFIIEGLLDTVSPKQLVLNTPENVAAYNKAKAHDKETRDIQEQRREESEKLWENVQHPSIGSDND